MPIINPPAPPSSAAQAQAQRYQADINRLFGQLSAKAKEIFNWIWNNSTLTPQEAFDAFGPNAGDLVKVSTAFNAMTTVYFGAPALVIPPGVTITVNQDGTVTVS